MLRADFKSVGQETVSGSIPPGARYFFRTLIIIFTDTQMQSNVGNVCKCFATKHPLVASCSECGFLCCEKDKNRYK